MVFLVGYIGIGGFRGDEYISTVSGRITWSAQGGVGLVAGVPSVGLTVSLDSAKAHVATEVGQGYVLMQAGHINLSSTRND